jgi:hypothetical protein
VFPPPQEIFVLQDNCFRWLRHVAGPSDDTAKAMELASLYLAYPCGMIKGAPSLRPTIPSAVVPVCELRWKLHGEVQGKHRWAYIKPWRC